MAIGLGQACWTSTAPSCTAPRASSTQCSVTCTCPIQACAHPACSQTRAHPHDHAAEIRVYEHTWSRRVSCPQHQSPECVQSLWQIWSSVVSFLPATPWVPARASCDIEHPHHHVWLLTHEDVWVMCPSCPSLCLCLMWTAVSILQDSDLVDCQWYLVWCAVIVAAVAIDRWRRCIAQHAFMRLLVSYTCSPDRARACLDLHACLSSRLFMELARGNADGCKQRLPMLPLSYTGMDQSTSAL